MLFYRSPPKYHVGHTNENNQFHEEVNHARVLKNGIVQQLLDHHFGNFKRTSQV